MSNINPNQMMEGQQVMSAAGGRGQAQQIMLVPATRQQQQQVVMQPLQQSTQSTQQHYILQPGAFENAQHTYQVRRLVLYFSLICSGDSILNDISFLRLMLTNSTDLIILPFSLFFSTRSYTRRQVKPFSCWVHHLWDI